MAHHRHSPGANHIALGAGNLPELQDRMASDGNILNTEITGGGTFYFADTDGMPTEVRNA